MAVRGGRHHRSEQGADSSRPGAAKKNQRPGDRIGSAREAGSDTGIDPDDRAYNGDATARTRSRKGATLAGSLRHRSAAASEVATFRIVPATENEKPPAVAARGFMSRSDLSLL